MKKFLNIFFLLVLVSACSNNSIKSNNLSSDDKNEKVKITSKPSDIVIEKNYAVNTNKETTITYPKILTTSSSSIEFAYDSENILTIFDGEKFGFMDRNGDEITPYIYQKAGPMVDKMAMVMLDGKYGFIDINGNEKIPLIYDKSTFFSEGLAYFEIGERYGFIDTQGNEVFTLDCDSVSSFKEGRAFFSIDGKYGYIDKNGEIVIDNIYDDVYFFHDNIALVRIGEFFGVIDLYGNEVLPIKFHSINIKKDEIEAFIGEETVVYNKNGTVKEKGLNIIYENENGDKIFILDEKYGLTNNNEEIIIEAIYDYLYLIEDLDFLVACIDDKYGIIDYTEQVKVPFTYDMIRQTYYTYGVSNYINVTINNKEGIMSLDDFKIIIPPIYMSVKSFHDGYAIVRESLDYGLINEKGEIIIPLGTYDYIFRISEHLLGLKKNNSAFIANNSGKLVSNKIYNNSYFPQLGDYLIFNYNGKNGLLDNKGNEVVPAEYDYIAGSYSKVYGGSVVGTTTNYNDEIKNKLILVEDSKKSDMGEIILTNVITPKSKIYHKYINEKVKTYTEFGEIYRKDFSFFSEYIPTIKLYKIDGISSPVLYYHDRPIFRSNFPESYSSIFTIENNSVNELIKATECGGSFRGNYIQLYIEKGSDKVLLGTKGLYGGFGGGYAGTHSYYESKNVKFTASWATNPLNIFGHSESFLLENAEFFYNSDGEQCSKDDILDGNIVKQFEINDKLVLEESFNLEVNKYIPVPMDLFGKWY